MGKNVCCSVESIWLRHLAYRGADNDKTGVQGFWLLLTCASRSWTTFFSSTLCCKQATLQTDIP